MLFRSLCVATLIVCCATPLLRAQEWESTVTPFSVGQFPPARSLRAQYGFGWNGITAATAEVRLTRKDGRYELEGSGGTTGLARTLWKFDAKHTSATDERTLRPMHVHEIETERSKISETHVTYTGEGVTSQREQRRGDTTKSKTRTFEFPHVMSLSSSFLFLRSQPLTDGAVYRIVVYPSTSAYLSTLTVTGREKITVPAGSYDAIKLDLQLNKIGKDRELKPHKKFKGATIWVSNDTDRLVLRIETQVFIGSVFAELQSVQFENGNHTAR